MERNSLHTVTASQMYKFYNRNPVNRRLPDCVCRAMSLALRKPYGYTMAWLTDNGICYDCDDLTVDCYSNILREEGYETSEANGRTVEQLCCEYPDNILLVRLNGHLTCCINGDCYDIWDCTNEQAERFWVIK